MSAIEYEAEVRSKQVTCWRYDELVRAGYAKTDALELALRTEVDLHVACELLSRSCPPALAVRILT